jgi:hypothetical protein
MYETRSARETASESLAISLLILFGVSLPVWNIASSEGGAAALDWTVAAGKLLFGQLGWTLTIYVTVLLAFYAVSIGGQILGDAGAAARVRRVLGFIAELLAAATIALVIFVAFYCWQAPAMWAIFFVLVPVVGIIVFLALQLGGFVVFAREIRLANAKRAQVQAREQLRRVRLRSRRPFWVVWVTNSAVIAALALLVSVAANLTGWAPLLLYVYYLIFAAIILAADAYSVREFLSSSDSFSRVTTWLLPFLLYLFLAAISFQTFFGSREPRIPPTLGWAFVTLIVLTLTTTFLPRARRGRAVLDWSIQGASARLAAKALAIKYSKAAREYRELKVSEEVEPPGLLRRIRDALRPPSPGGRS